MLPSRKMISSKILNTKKRGDGFETRIKKNPSK